MKMKMKMKAGLTVTASMLIAAQASAAGEVAQTPATGMSASQVTATETIHMTREEARAALRDAAILSSCHVCSN